MEQKIRTPYGTVRIYRNGPRAPRSVMVVPGYSETITHNRALIDVLAGKGYDAFTFSQPRRGPSRNPLDRQKDIILSALAATIPGDKKVHAIAHSLGSAALLRAAREHPERFASLLLMEPSGIVGIQSFYELVRRVGTKIKNNHVNARRRKHRGQQSATLSHIVRTQLASNCVIARNPLLALREAKVATHHVIADDIVAIMALEIPIHIVNAYGDELFGLPKSGVGYDQIITFAGSYSSHTDSSAGHDTFWIHPEQTAETIEVFINQLSKDHES